MRVCPAVLVVSVGAVLAESSSLARAIAGEVGFWERVADPHRGRFDRLVQEAGSALAAAQRPAGSRELAAVAETKLGEALRLVPGDFKARFLLGTAQSLLGRPGEAAQSFERARALARLPNDEAECSYRLGVEKTRLGRYAEAIVEYDREVRLSTVDRGTHANAAELLMALGRLSEAEDRYREAIRIDEQMRREGYERRLALSYYGLGVALDRDGQAAAAREAVARATALDRQLDRLKEAFKQDGDVFFVPDGDVHYYLGLACLITGRNREAQDAFRRFLDKLPASPWAPRARAHLDALAGHTPAPRWAPFAPPGGGFAVKSVATVRSDGPIASPLVDAAFRERPRLFDPCVALVPGPPRDGLRVRLEVEIDAAGAATRAAAVLATPGMPDVGACIEAQVRSGLRLPRPAHPRPTTAQIDIFFAS